MSFNQKETVLLSVNDDSIKNYKDEEARKNGYDNFVVNIPANLNKTKIIIFYPGSNRGNPQSSVQYRLGLLNTYVPKSIKNNYYIFVPPSLDAKSQIEKYGSNYLEQKIASFFETDYLISKRNTSDSTFNPEEVLLMGHAAGGMAAMRYRNKFSFDLKKTVFLDPEIDKREFDNSSFDEPYSSTTDLTYTGGRMLDVYPIELYEEMASSIYASGGNVIYDTEISQDNTIKKWFDDNSPVLDESEPQTLTSEAESNSVAASYPPGASSGNYSLERGSEWSANRVIESGAFLNRDGAQYRQRDNSALGIISDLNKEALYKLQKRSQCVLISNIKTLALNNKGSVYKNFTPIHGNPSSLMSNISPAGNPGPFWNVKPEEISRLNPIFKLFKVFYDSKGQESLTVEMPFTGKIDVSSLSDITTSKISRGSGVGLDSFSWKFQGSDPYTASNIIECNLSLRFESFNELIKIRKKIVDKNGIERSVSYVDFFSPEKRLNDKTNEYNANYFTFKILVGWSDPDSLKENGGKRWSDLAKSVRRNRTGMIFSLVGHNLEIKQEGVVYLNIDGISRMDVSSHSKDADIFTVSMSENEIQRYRLLEKNANKVLKEIEDCINKSNKSDSLSESQEKKVNDDQKNKKTLERQLNRYERELKSNKSKIYGNILKQILENNGMYAVSVPPEKISYKKVDPYENLPAESRGSRGPVRYEFVDDIESNVEIKINQNDIFLFNLNKKDRSLPDLNNNNLEEQLQQSRINATSNYTFSTERLEATINIPFFYFGSILDVALSAYHGEANKYTDSNFKTLVGDVVIYDPQEFRKYSVNLADIPISYSLFHDWFIENVYKKQKDVFPVKEFIKSALTDLVFEALKPRNCFSETPRRSLKLSISGVNIPVNENVNNAVSNSCKKRMHVDDLSSKNREFLNLEKDKIMQYQIFYASDIIPSHLIADPIKDEEKGILWCYIGKNCGLIKEIKFSRKDFQGLRSARIANSDGDRENAIASLREVYEAEITMFGNNYFIPGQYIFINPAPVVLGSPSVTQSQAANIGLVGYYIVRSVDNKISAGVYETTVKALWQALGDGKTYLISQNMQKTQQRCGWEADNVSDQEEKEIMQRNESSYNEVPISLRPESPPGC